MNRLIVYMLVAILFGMVTMVVPLALLKNNGTIPTGQYPNNTTEGVDDTQNRTFDNQGPPNESNDNGSSSIVSDQTLLIDSASGLTSIGLMVVPSLFLALGVFAYIRKRI
ncbi:hypothetical protein AC477_05430 [miscellaneous Crenarchaeota group-1 archaeon SG8-32-1]|uniref:Uncharacterized protein n=1 Tax=miscellaneous Crenarchaeota group-1 archaeon SG8-32-1 TaxID=1685124 RepID=A0A0M0BN71_9ARCH|nr:MAG: hypothetical protein AC477_05430 [miscellaneous Crenarchaeota group-1 archaeon SG8-32-1]